MLGALGCSNSRNISTQLPLQPEIEAPLVTQDGGGGGDSIFSIEAEEAKARQAAAAKIQSVIRGYSVRKVARAKKIEAEAEARKVAVLPEAEAKQAAVLPEAEAKQAAVLPEEELRQAAEAEVRQAAEAEVRQAAEAAEAEVRQAAEALLPVAGIGGGEYLNFNAAVEMWFEALSRFLRNSNASPIIHVVASDKIAALCRQYPVLFDEYFRRNLQFLFQILCAFKGGCQLGVLKHVKADGNEISLVEGRSEEDFYLFLGRTFIRLRLREFLECLSSNAHTRTKKDIDIKYYSSESQKSPGTLLQLLDRKSVLSIEDGSLVSNAFTVTGHLSLIPSEEEEKSFKSEPDFLDLIEQTLTETNILEGQESVNDPCLQRLIAEVESIKAEYPVPELSKKRLSELLLMFQPLRKTIVKVDVLGFKTELETLEEKEKLLQNELSESTLTLTALEADARQARHDANQKRKDAARKRAVIPTNDSPVARKLKEELEKLEEELVKLEKKAKKREEKVEELKKTLNGKRIFFVQLINDIDKARQELSVAGLKQVTHKEADHALIERRQQIQVPGEH